jgi:hypothetical protein
MRGRVLHQVRSVCVQRDESGQDHDDERAGGRDLPRCRCIPPHLQPDNSHSQNARLLQNDAVLRRLVTLSA